MLRIAPRLATTGLTVCVQELRKTKESVQPEVTSASTTDKLKSVQTLATATAQPKSTVSFADTKGDWHMEFHHPQTGEVVERFPAKKVISSYERSQHNRV